MIILAIGHAVRVRGYSDAALGVEKAVVNLNPLRFNRAKGGSHDSITDSGFALCQLRCGGSI